MSSSASMAQMLLLLCGDVEANPGPPGSRRRGEEKPDKAKIMADKVESHDKKLEELEALVKSQSQLIEDLTTKHSELKVDSEKRAEEMKVESEKRVEDLKVESREKLERLEVALEAAVEDNKVLGSRVQDQHREQVERDQRLQQELMDRAENAKKEQERVTDEIRKELKSLRSKLSAGVDELGSQSGDTAVKVQELESDVDEILEKLWEIDKTWKNNLVFYGVKCEQGMDEHPTITENKVRDIIKTRMGISRDIAILRVKRTWNGPMVRGSKPITACFERWQDKEEILRKTKFLKGTNIYVGEDFSRRVKDQRQELKKFMKVIRNRRPLAKISLQYDKLFVDKDVFMFNDLTGQVEQVNQSTVIENYDGTSPVPTTPGHSAGVRKSSGGRPNAATPTRRLHLQKSFSTEASLNHVDDGPVYASNGGDAATNGGRESPRKSPRRKITGMDSSPTKRYTGYDSDSSNPPSPRKKNQHHNYQSSGGNGHTNGNESSSEVTESPRKRPPPPPASSSSTAAATSSGRSGNGNNASHNNSGSLSSKDGEDEGEDDIIEYRDISQFSPVKKNPDIPETIPE